MKYISLVLPLLLMTSASAIQIEGLPYPHLYSFGSNELSEPYDVAVYAPCDKKEYVFVTDVNLGNLVRFRFDGRPNLTPLHIPVATAFTQVRGVAVNDIPGHCNEGQVYVVVAYAFHASIHVYGIDGSYKMELFPDLGGTWWGASGIDCDAHGNVYMSAGLSVFDPLYGSRTAKFNASRFDPSNYGTQPTLPPDQIFGSSPNRVGDFAWF